jgi:hypothetical protein
MKRLVTTCLAALVPLLAGYKAMSSESASIAGPHQPRAGISGVLKDRPFHATFEITGTAPSPEDPAWVAEMFRNRAGSIRTELSGNRSGWIIDAETGRFTVLDHTTRAAVVSPYKTPDAEDSGPRWGFHKFPTFTDESATILGVTCKKVLLSSDKARSSPAGDVWIAYDLGVVMQDDKPQGAGWTVWRAVSLDQSEPDPSVFQIPQGYRVIEQ